MYNEKNFYVPHVFDRVHNDAYGYGTVIGVEDADEKSYYTALVLFDKESPLLHIATNYENLCDSYIYVPHRVRSRRCYWCDVRDLSTYSELLESEELSDTDVRIVPFGSLEYKEHPIRLVCSRTKDSVHTFNASIVNINTKGKILVLADDGGYCWVDAENLSFCNELIGTVVPVNIEETTLDDKEEDVGEDTVDSPSYYKTARVEPNELMSDLMSFEQHEGFLWGNIIKYAYRYGNKGEKAETVKKIRKYCDMLLEVLEPKNELED